MSYEIAYFPVFVDNLLLWKYKKCNASEEEFRKLYGKKISRIEKYLENEFKDISTSYKDITIPHDKDIPKHIWMLWWQGEEQMPIMQRLCVDSVRKFAVDYDITTITKHNYEQYIDVSDIIGYLKERHFGQSRLTMQFFSDIVRTRLLKKYGGVWLDATLFFPSAKLFNKFFVGPYTTLRITDFPDNKLLFAPGKGRFCTSLQASCTNNPYFEYIDECLTYHVNHHKTIWDYFLLEYSTLIGEKK